jgi:glycosyltransferase involved in cell wall biosynthesis
LSKKILFLTTHNLATNPRLVKEIRLALQNDFYVTVVCCDFDNWSKDLNEKIKETLLPQIQYIGLPANRKPLFSWVQIQLTHVVSKTLLSFFPENGRLLSVSLYKLSGLLLRQVKRMNESYDLVIAHNPGSFHPAKYYGNKHQIPFAIDLEDYHPGESKVAKTTLEIKRLQQFILPGAEYVTAASPLIMAYAQKDINQELKNAQVILNLFPSEEFVKPVTKTTEKLKLVWFSQQISYGRGLEQFIPAIKNNPNVELHLFGNSDPEFKAAHLSVQNIFIHDTLPQKELHKKLSEFDIGLAIEPGKDVNNKLSISNKILAYFQAGLYILASGTEAQKEFMEQHPNHGIVASLDADSLIISIKNLLVQKESLRSNAKDRFENASSFCWEKEAQLLLNIWRDV